MTMTLVKAHPWALFSSTLGICGLTVALGSQGVLLRGERVLFIFDTGEEGGTGHPGRDVKTGVDRALLDFKSVFSAKKISWDIQNDRGIPGVAQKLAQEAIADERVVTVVGHLQSTVMASTLDAYLRSDLPVIMPVPTNPHLTEESAKSKNKNLLRMSPTDTQQAEIAAEFILSKNRKRIAVIKDIDNATYSEYLARKFIASVRSSSGSDRTTIVSVTAVGGTASGDLPLIKSLEADAIFFAGSTDNAITLLEMINALMPSESHPLILMTDGVVDSTFLRRVSVIPDELYVTFQWSAEFNDARGVKNGACSNAFALSFCSYGYDAVFLLQQLLQQAYPGFDEPIGRMYKNISRKDLLDVINDDLKVKKKPLSGHFNNTYIFDAKGDNVGFGFSVWKANQHSKQFEDIRFNEVAFR